MNQRIRFGLGACLCLLAFIAEGFVFVSGTAANPVSKTAAVNPVCPIVPIPRDYQPTGETVPLGTDQTAAIVLPVKANAANRYAAERLQTLVKNRFKVQLPICDSETALAQAVTQRFVLAVDPKAVLNDGQSAFNGFCIRFADPLRRIEITGADDAGLIYGAEALFNLIAKDASGAAQITVAAVRDWPSIQWRGRPHSVMAHQLQPGQLDAYVHGRINFIDYRDDPRVPESLTMAARKSSMGCPPGLPIDADLARKVLDEGHRRAMYVYGTVSCNITEDKYNLLGKTFDELLALGCDGIWVSMDDTGGGKDPCLLAQYAADYMKKSGKQGHDMLFTPGGQEYTTIERPLNRAMAQIDTFNNGTWIFTRVPCKKDAQLAREIGLKQKVAWWYNYCETSYPDPKAGFIHSSAVLTTQRKDGRPSYMNLLPITPGWGSPEFDKIRDAAENVDHINIWAMCGGWPAEYAVVMFGQWGWNPENCDWNRLRDSIYDFVWGPSQVPLITEFDKTWVELKDLYLLPRNWGFRTPDNSLVRLKMVENRARALELLDKLDKLAAQLAAKAPEETALDLQRLEYQYIEPILTSLKFARKQATLDYPEYEFGQFEIQAAEIQSTKGEQAANEYLARVHATVNKQLEALSRELSELKDIEPVLDLWRVRLSKGKTVSEINKAELAKRKVEWDALVKQPVKEYLPFLEEPLEGNLTSIFDSMQNAAPAGTLATRASSDWTCAPTQAVGGYRVGTFNRGGIQTAAIVVPRHTKTQEEQFGWVEQTFDLAKLVPGNVAESIDLSKDLKAQLFLADNRIDHVYRGVRRIDVSVNGKTVFSRDLADPAAPDWIEFPVSTVSSTDSTCKIVVRVTELRPVGDHTSWVFVGPLRIVRKTAAVSESASAIESASASDVSSDVCGSHFFAFSYFTGNGEDGLHLALSRDGLNWKPINGGKPLYNQTLPGDNLMRDPSICRAPDGTFHLVWTSSWKNQFIGHASSRDLIHWTESQMIPVMAHEPTSRNTWAPEIFYDEPTEQYYIVWSSTIPGRFSESGTSEDRYDHRMYYTTTKDFQTFAPTKLYFNPGYNVIDGFLAKRGATYYLFYKDERLKIKDNPPQEGKSILVTTGPTAAGPFPPGKIISPHNWVEGPTAFQIDGDWLVLYDCYTRHQYGGVRSSDGTNWTEITDQISLPKEARHGTVFEIDESMYQQLTQ